MRTGFDRAWGDIAPADLEFGRRAYQAYHDLCRRWAEHYGFGFVQTVEAFATLSPNADYKSNIRSLSSCMDGLNRGLRHDRISASTYGTMKRKALDYLRGDRSFLDEAAGPKIRAFRECILYVEKARQPVIDGHMVGVWAGQRMTMREADQTLRQARYGHLAEALSRTARRSKVPVCVAQATLWSYSKRSNGVLFSTQLDLFADGTEWDRVPHPDDYPPYPFREGVET